MTEAKSIQLTSIGKDLATSPSDIRVLLKHFVQLRSQMSYGERQFALAHLVDAPAGGFSPHIKQDADVWSEQRSKGIEEPSMRVELLLVLPTPTINSGNG